MKAMFHAPWLYRHQKLGKQTKFYDNSLTCEGSQNFDGSVLSVGPDSQLIDGNGEILCHGVDEALRNYADKIKAVAVLIGPGDHKSIHSGVSDAIKLGLDLDVPVVLVAGHDVDLLAARRQQELPFPIMSVRLNDSSTEVVYS